MTLTLDLMPEVEERVRAGAIAAGMSEGEYAAMLLAQAAPPLLTADEKLQKLKELFAGIETDPAAHSPAIPLEALAREAIYGQDDHDEIDSDETE